MIRSAKMNDTTPPKLMPPFQRTAASGTLPIEHTKLTTATIGPTIGPQIGPSTGWSVRKNRCQKSIGTQAASAPAMSSPAAMSRQTAAHSITKMCDTAVNPRAEVNRCRNEPPPVTDMSIAACPSMEPASPRSAWRKASATRRRRSATR